MQPDLSNQQPASVTLGGTPQGRSSPALQREPARRATILAGLLEGALAMFGLWFIGIPLGAFFSVVFYRRHSPASQLSPGLGARLGLISGAIGFVIFAVAGSVELLLSHNGAGLREQVMKQLEQMAAQYPPQAQQALDYLKSAQGWGLIVAMSTVFTLLMFLFLSTVAGAAGGAALAKKDRNR
ncbi:MAG TPA: hypothetical protein VMT53_15855 [Terriglobales bacterium]|nr:hypothetical protein [Terriglobales bacterium]